MAHISDPDWDPRAAEFLADQIAAYDALRRRQSVVFGAHGTWSVLGHADVVRVLDDPETFSNVVSTRRSVPNGMDPPEHTPFRSIVDRFFTPDRMAAVEPEVRRIARTLVAALPRDENVEVMSALGDPFASQVQCAFMGWPDRLHEPLQHWTEANHAATRSGDREAMAEVALQFDSYIREQLDERRAAGAAAPDDNTTRLLHETVDGRPLTDDEIVSIVRNWTVGELATIAASVGILCHHLATDPGTDALLRNGGVDLAAASDEVLRIHAPLLANRRRTTQAVELGGRTIPAGETVHVVWASANRDEAATGDPDRFDLERDPADNLLYGRGIHVCPGAPLARLELRIVLEELLAATTSIELGDGPQVLAQDPASGFETLSLRFT